MKKQQQEKGSLDVDPSIEPRGKLTCLDEQFKISKVYNCEGLLLCILKDDDTKVVVWNPYWGQTRWIKPRDSHNRMYRYMYALGYENKKNKSCPNHKILKIVFDWLSRLLLYEIYDFETGLWTPRDVPPPIWFKTFDKSRVCLKGNTYWCAMNLIQGKLEYHVICFDFTRERFGPFLHLPFRAGMQDHVTLSCVREEKLAVSLQRHRVPYKIEIWITTKIEAEKLSWSKFLTIAMGPNFVKPDISTSFSIEDEEEEKKFVMGCYEKYFRKLDFGECVVRGCRASVCSYVPSSMQIKQHAGCKRKKT